MSRKVYLVRRTAPRRGRTGGRMKGPAGNTTRKRLRILRDDEIDALYGRPRFTPEEREEYFAISPAEAAALEQFHSIKSRIHAILQLGYFKARQMFFALDRDEIAEDARYIQERYFPRIPCPDQAITKVTRLRQQRVILTLCNYRTCDAEERRRLATRARLAARVCGKPVYVFRELRRHLAEHRLVAPGYSFLQETVGQALLAEQSRLTTLVRQQLEPAESAALQQLLEDAQGRYGITSLKREPRDFGWREMTRELGRWQQLQPLYDIASRLLPHLQISNESVTYYAALATYYTVFRLKQLDEDLARIYLLAFVHHRFRRLNDNLINGLIYHVRRFTDAAKAAAKERVYAARIEGSENLQKAGQVRMALGFPLHRCHQSFARLGSRFHQITLLLWPTLVGAGFDPAESVSDLVAGDRLQHLSDQRHSIDRRRPT